ncbi:DUF1178 family protein [Piscinibacter koreensis]|uniref:DUF1178 family protein n=1 Tax=Piscinibacter koreensis TaxID=2742824 RepID=A0A7Y6NRT6_9BURK|nr:DUF1178 family protein [Schlegelella koreensis]NUZ08145.1 DUF1178 family protein [Schlegelella koreensis]
MKVLDLCCANEHRFEGWFASEDDYRAQQAEGRVECPLCADTAIRRLPSAPRLNVTKAAPPEVPAPAGVATPAPLNPQALWLRAVRHVLANTEDVGDRFVDEARRMHRGEIDERAIRGQASREDAEALRDEGVEVLAIELPDALKQTLQ